MDLTCVVGEIFFPIDNSFHRRNIRSPCIFARDEDWSWHDRGPGRRKGQIPAGGAGSFHNEISNRCANQRQTISLFSSLSLSLRNSTNSNFSEIAPLFPTISSSRQWLNKFSSNRKQSHNFPYEAIVSSIHRQIVTKKRGC